MNIRFCQHWSGILTVILLLNVLAANAQERQSSEEYQQRKVKQLSGASPFEAEIRGKDRSRILFQDSLLTVFALTEERKQAPVHLLAVPNERIPTLNDVQPHQIMLLGQLTAALVREAKKMGITETGYRIALNTNEDAGQSVFHVHAHLLGGMKLGAMAEQTWRNEQRAKREGLQRETTTFAEGFADNKGVKTYYRIYGSKGAPVLIINGGPGMSSDGFADLAKHLSANNQAIIFDQRGTGKTRLPMLDSDIITMQNMVNDMEALRKHLGIERWTLLGHSFGGILAAYYSSQHPTRVEKLIFSASGGINLDFMRYVGESVNERLTQAERDSVAFWTARISAGDTSYHARLRRGLALAPAYVFDKRFVPQIAERLTQGNMRLNALVFADLQRIKFDCTEQLRGFAAPVLIIQGKNDIIKTETAEYARKVLPNSHLVLLNSCGHYGWLDAEKEYLTAVKSFLTFGLTRER